MAHWCGCRRASCVNFEASAMLPVELSLPVADLSSSLNSRPGILVWCTQRTWNVLSSGFLAKTGVSSLLFFCSGIDSVVCEWVFALTAWRLIVRLMRDLTRFLSKITTICCECVDPLRFRFRLVGVVRSSCELRSKYWEVAERFRSCRKRASDGKRGKRLGF